MSAFQPGIEIRPIAGCIGAEVLGVDLTAEISQEQFELIHQAFLEYLVIFLPQDKVLTPAHLTAFARHFGELDDDPFVFPFKIPAIEGYPEIYSNIKTAENTGINIGGYWHADVTYRKKPHRASVIYAREVPEYGGDTMFANQYLAYDTLPDEIKQEIRAMEAVHSSAMPHGQSAARFASVDRNHAPAKQDSQFEKSGLEIAVVEVIENTHPVVRRHPQTGRKLLYVNRGFTSHFVGMSPQESLPLLEALWAHASRAELTCRYRWTQNAVAVWDNCATHHYAINDYYGQHRHMQRVSIHED
jgi:taurine dioxygenase